MIQTKGYWSCYTINSQKSGKFKGIEIDSECEQNNIVEYELFAKSGDSIFAFTGSDKRLGLMVLKYFSMEEMLEKMNEVKKWLKVNVKDENKVRN